MLNKVEKHFISERRMEENLKLTDKEWGIDLTGRKMWYESWLVDESGNYKTPDEKEIEEIYGISGEAVEETLLYFEECGGDTKKLISMLNEHIIDERFIATRKTLLNKSRWYNNEYYFYFIMFTKKVIGRYDFHFGEGSDKQLSIYHRSFESGFLQFHPWGIEIKEQGGIYVEGGILLTQHLIEINKSYCKDIFQNELILFLQSVLEPEFSKITNIIFLKKEFNWYSLEFLFFIMDLFIVFSNRDDLVKDIPEYYLTEKNNPYVLYLLRAVSILGNIYTLRKITNIANRIIDTKIIKNRKESFIFQIKLKSEFVRKYKGYKYIRHCLKNYEIAYQGAFFTIIPIIYRLEKHPKPKIYISKSNVDTESYSEFIVKWTKKKKINLFFIFPIIISILVVFFFRNIPILLCITIASFFSIFFQLFLNLRLKNINIEKDNIIEDNMEDFQKSRNKLEKITEELLKEKQNLEEKVKDRTAELAEANRKLKELDRVKTNFFANVSHELRTPLTNIRLYIETIIKGKFGKLVKADDKIFSRMHRQTIKLNNQINNILDFSKIELYKMEPKKQKINLYELLRFYVSEVESTARAKNIAIEFLSGSDIAVIGFIDPKLFESAIFNLINNALKFTPAGGKINVSLYKNDQKISIAIRDTGIGIPEEKLVNIFTRFYQVETAPDRKYEGAGIGLSLVKDIVELHNGEIKVESRVGEGSCFTITLPLAEEPVEIGAIDFSGSTFKEQIKAESPVIIDKPVVSSLSPLKETILLVEDNPELVENLKTLFSDEYRLLTASNGRVAVEKLFSSEVPDLIISDIMMPRMDGIEFLQKVRENPKYSGVPFIFLSAKAAQEV